MVDVLRAVRDGSPPPLSDLELAREVGLVWAEGLEPLAVRLTNFGLEQLSGFEAELADAHQTFKTLMEANQKAGWAVVAVRSGDPDITLVFTAADQDLNATPWTREQAIAAFADLARSPDSAGYRMWLESPGGERFGPDQF